MEGKFLAVLQHILSVELLAAAVLLFGAGIVRGFTGFGAALLLAPVLAYLFGAANGVAIIILLNMFVSVQLMSAALRVSNFAGVGWVTVGACAAMPLGVWALGSFDPEVARNAISILVIIACLFIALPYQDYLKVRSSPMLDSLAGGLGGLLHGFAGIGGPPIIIYLIAQNASAAVLRANIILSFAIINVVTTLVFFLSGLLSTTIMLQTILLTPPFLLGAWVGQNIFGRSSEKLFMRVVLILLTLVAAGMLFAD
jgi:uncharacterized membrane protein YfcA